MPKKSVELKFGYLKKVSDQIVHGLHNRISLYFLYQLEEEILAPDAAFARRRGGLRRRRSAVSRRP